MKILLPDGQTIQIFRHDPGGASISVIGAGNPPKATSVRLDRTTTAAVIAALRETLR